MALDEERGAVLPKYRNPGRQQGRICALLLRERELLEDRVCGDGNSASAFLLHDELRIDRPQERVRPHQNLVRRTREHRGSGHRRVRHDHANVSEMCSQVLDNGFCSFRRSSGRMQHEVESHLRIEIRQHFHEALKVLGNDADGIRIGRGLRPLARVQDDVPFRRVVEPHHIAASDKVEWTDASRQGLPAR